MDYEPSYENWLQLTFFDNNFHSLSFLPRLRAKNNNYTDQYVVCYGISINFHDCMLYLYPNRGISLNQCVLALSLSKEHFIGDHSYGEGI